MSRRNKRHDNAADRTDDNEEAGPLNDKPGLGWGRARREAETADDSQDAPVGGLVFKLHMKGGRGDVVNILAKADDLVFADNDDGAHGNIRTDKLTLNLGSAGSVTLEHKNVAHLTPSDNILINLHHADADLIDEVETILNQLSDSQEDLTLDFGDGVVVTVVGLAVVHSVPGTADEGF